MRDVADALAGGSAHSVAKRSEAGVQLLDDRVQRGVAGVAGDLEVEVADELALEALLVLGVPLNPLRPDELVTGGVLADDVVGEQRASHRVGRHDRPCRVDGDDGHVVEADEDALDGRGNLARGDPGGGVGVAGQAVQGAAAVVLRCSARASAATTDSEGVFARPCSRRIR